MDYINENTQEFIKNKIFVFNTENKIISKHDITINDNLKNNLFDNEKFLITNNIIYVEKYLNDINDNFILNLEKKTIMI